MDCFVQQSGFIFRAGWYDIIMTATLDDYAEEVLKPEKKNWCEMSHTHK